MVAGVLLSGCSTAPKLSEAFGFDYPTAVESETKKAPDSRMFVVKTTAYTHLEEDSLQYGNLTALGTPLKSVGEERSAAADWSRYPVGTKFRILGQPQVYVVDDYGSALVGTDTIDIYQPCFTTMRSWGAPIVGIEVIEWGSVEKSVEILESRASAAEHVREMLDTIKQTEQLGPRGMGERQLPVT